jgi:hypothetical protein
MGADQSCKCVLVRWAMKATTFVNARKAAKFEGRKFYQKSKLQKIF